MRNFVQLHIYDKSAYLFVVCFTGCVHVNSINYLVSAAMAHVVSIPELLRFTVTTS